MTVITASVAASKGRVLIIGATGFIGQFVAEASLDSGRATFVLARSFYANPSKAKTIKSLQDKGATVLHGAIRDQELMERLLKEHEIEIVVSARFLPSEFGHDVDRADPVEPGLTMYKEKREIRRLIEECGVPYTYILCNSIASWPYYDNTHPSEVIPPLDQFQIYAYFVAGSDIGKFTMKAADDFRTLNKSVHFRPSCNCLNINELASLWEKKIGRVLPRVTVTEDDLLAAARENVIPQSIVASFTHDIFIKGCQVNFSIEGPDEVEVSDLYPDESFRTVDACFDDFVAKMEIDRRKSANEGITTKNHGVEVLPITAMCA
ncbi:hypothetical protein RHGRI_026970 [Rhododendron griersonianum]|uniref:NmrA-like domain-containing protein n=1 Tax=Rhododendron griersonianum TaxID=479676 RepID=A0AAV6IYN2_9ERIC|nr:hypothetical protein RHGRI_026970 [Rhododendron griersonianum]